jgi:hypothetical protein
MSLVAEPVVEAIRSFFPQFDNFRPDPVTTPSRRARRRRCPGERFVKLGHPLFEHRSTIDHFALVAGDGTTTGPRRSRPPVGIRLIVIDLLHRSVHPDLAVHWEEPVEESSAQWIGLQIPALVAFPVGVED